MWSGRSPSLHLLCFGNLCLWGLLRCSCLVDTGATPSFWGGFGELERALSSPTVIRDGHRQDSGLRAKCVGLAEEMPALWFPFLKRRVYILKDHLKQFLLISFGQADSCDRLCENTVWDFFFFYKHPFICYYINIYNMKFLFCWMVKCCTDSLAGRMYFWAFPICILNYFFVCLLKRLLSHLQDKKTSLTFVLDWSYAEIRYHWTSLEVSCLQLFCNARYKAPECSCCGIRDGDIRYVVEPRGANIA